MESPRFAVPRRGRALRAKAELSGKLEDDVAARHGLAVPEDRAEVLRRLEALLG